MLSDSRACGSGQIVWRTQRCHRENATADRGKRSKAPRTNKRDKSGTMKPRHAAALALMGWYLLAPPLYKGEVDEKAPLKEWAVLQSFRTVAEIPMVVVLLDKADPDPATRTVEASSSGFVLRVDRRPAPEGKIVMNLRHTAALALIGWLMLLCRRRRRPGRRAGDRRR